MIQQMTFDNGLRLMVDQRESPFATIAYVVDVGAQDEGLDQLGMAHLVEHLVFKGTVNRTVDQINRDIDELGGELNAYTCEERTVFFSTLLAEHAETAVDVLSDLVFGNTVPEDEFEREKAVVMEELTMYHDRGEQRVHELALRTRFPGHPNRWTVGGTVDSVRAFTRGDVLRFIDDYYVPTHVTVVVTGGVGLDQVRAWVEARTPSFTDVPREGTGFAAIEPADVGGEPIVERMDLGQSHVAFTWVLPGAPSAREVFTAVLAASVLGDGLGSRLGRIREQHGYCYTISCSTASWRDALLVYGYMGVNLANIPHAKRLVGEIIDECRRDGLEDWEYRKAVNKLVVSLLMDDVTTEDANEWRVEHIKDDGFDLEPSGNRALVESITKAEVEAFIRDHLDPADVCFAEVHQLDDNDDDEEDDD